MRIFILFITAGLLTGLNKSAEAQQPGQSLNDFYRQQPKKNTLGFGPGFLFRTDTVRVATIGGVIKKYYPSGQMYEQAAVSDLQKGTLNGEHTRWYENGQVQLQEKYQADELEGEQVIYYPSGAVKTRRQYLHGKLLESGSFTLNGTPQNAPELLVFPEYPGGLLPLLTDIQKRTNYPRPLIRQNVTGKVVVEFLVDAQGRVQQARVRQSVHPQLDAEALRVVNSLRGWTPGRLDGDAADVMFGLPVTFTIR
ncbi:energy transducer TonB [Hymenobacter wooponensis]|uniref:TonB family protein n=1 Tax=Hymenobacter wooponensis TaxID=1525360 RepID=A0A4Z0MLD7_9BACT|nr:energy transducer TonB [Hymenobacter wooponensis]TGD80239.1 TonB family protein [Hymenobacter wooponensis]